MMISWSLGDALLSMTHCSDREKIPLMMLRLRHECPHHYISEATHFVFSSQELARANISVVLVCLQFSVKILFHLRNNVLCLLTWVMHFQPAQHRDLRQLQVHCGLPLTRIL